ncbi:MAG: transglutaminase family protein [Candidatus Sulfopaludibacter sp.]|nr:transglutaminase family protein [Candidatus Sulfopaludibacter sp.]
MTYRIVHKTTYTYKVPVSFGNHIAYLTPRSLAHQRCASHELLVTPAPAGLIRRLDYFGNSVTFFTIREPHDELQVVARSHVVLEDRPAPWPAHAPPWEVVARCLPADLSPEGLEAYQFVFESPRVKPGSQFAEYASPSFSAGRPLTEALLDLTGRIHKDFRFDANATNVRTPPEEVLRHKRGVCQDFAHLQVACLRSLGLPARYVSGYLRTYPPPGRARLVGADASHAWVSVYCPGAGWLDVDPTNNLIPFQSHVTLSWGRDYGDVSPVRGVIQGGRDHKVQVGVDMEPGEDSEGSSMPAPGDELNLPLR